MASITTYICDRCGAQGTQNKNDQKEGYLQLWQVGISFIIPAQQNPHSYRPLAKEVEWCRECAEKFDLLSKKKNEHDNLQKTMNEKTPYIPATVEDILREIVQEEIENSQQN